MELTLNSLVALTVADIDIFLLKTEDQKHDNDKEVFTRAEIREQLSKTAKKVQNVLRILDFSINEPLLNKKDNEVFYF